MDIELKHKALKDRDFNSGLAKLSRYTGFAPKQLYNVSRIVDKVRQADRASGELWEKMIQPFMQKDDTGKVIPQIDEATGKELPGTFAIPDDKKVAFTKAVEEFYDVEFQIKRNRIPLGDLEGVGLNANELLALEPIIHGLELVEGEAQNGNEEKSQESQGQEKSH